MIYLDFSATSPLDPSAKKAMLEVMELSERRLLGNPSSLHTPGSRGRDLLSSARKSVANLVNASPNEIIFTSGGSESNNTVMNIFDSCPIFVSKIEHPSVLAPAEEHAEPLYKIPVSSEGVISLDFLKEKLDFLLESSPKKKILISVMTANNETGVLEPLEEVSTLIKEYREKGLKKLYFHTDATQAVGKIPLDTKSLGVDYLTISAHKLGGPVGIGALFVRTGAPYKPLILGGEQENKRRAGTSNALLAAGFKAVAEKSFSTPKKYKEVAKLRDWLASEILRELPTAKILTAVGIEREGTKETILGREAISSEQSSKGELSLSLERSKKTSRISGGDHEGAQSTAGVSRGALRSARLDDDRNPTEVSRSEKDSDSSQYGKSSNRSEEIASRPSKSLPNILNVSFPSAEGESTQLYLDLAGFAVSTGSACASGDLEPSHVIMSMTGDAEIAHNSVRFSLGLDTKKSDLKKLIKTLKPIVSRLQSISTIKLKEQP